MRHRGAGEAAMGPMLSVKRRELSAECRGHPADRESLPPIDGLRTSSRHEHFDGLPRRRYRKVGKPHLRGDPNVGAILPHPHFGGQFVDHARISDRDFDRESRAG